MQDNNNAQYSFHQAFLAVSGNRPFPWQQALYDRLVSNRADNIPASCILPTGLGKTRVVAVWLIALATHPQRVPRRLVYVVNRRTVVDQTTNEVVRLRERLDTAGLTEPLQRLCAIPADSPLAISTLRGEFADNREWSADPSRPAVIVGTVDMIGSRLLFSGYGVGYRSKPLHAGFLGQDALLVHDEAHLEPAFQALVDAIAREQAQTNDARLLRVMELTATSRADDASGENETFDLTPQEKLPRAIPKSSDNPLHVVWRRQTAPKAIHLHELESGKRVDVKVADLALVFKDSGAAILVFLRQVEDVEKVVEKLRKDKQKVQQLTGTLRGLERDRLAKADEIFARFLPPTDRAAAVAPESGTVYLVCTSAGEVGVNLSADHMVCDLSTFDSMAQRFGRVNRFGDRPDTEIHVVHPAEFEDDERDQRRRLTLELLKELDGDGSPCAIGQLGARKRQAAFAPAPKILRTSDILFDSWALTTIRGELPGRPPVPPYLHGVSDWEPPETRVAWREEVGVITGDLLDRYHPADLLDDYPLKPRELLRDRSDRVFKHLTAIAARRPECVVWIVDEAEESVEPVTLKELSDKNNKERIYGRTVLLPPQAGGLVVEGGESRGMLNGGAKYEPEWPECYDVADQWFTDTEQDERRRQRLWEPSETPDGMCLIRRIVIAADDDDEATDERTWSWFERLKSAESDEGLKSSQKHVLLETHRDDVVGHATQIAKALRLDDALRNVLIIAAKYHDAGKRRVKWQRSIGNPTPEVCWAKSDRWMPPLTGYRHEFGSLTDVLVDDEFQRLDGECQDLVLHLIAAHHGRARPHFPDEEAFDPEPCEQDPTAVAVEVPRRFARLQRKHGRWGLAYLESLLRAADYAASANPTLNGKPRQR